MKTKLFKKIELIDSKSIEKLTKQLSGIKVNITIIWPTNLPLCLFKLHQKKDGAWINLITNAISESDGELTVELGYYKKDDLIEIAYGIMSFENISRSAILVIEDNKKVFKVKPENPDEFQALNKFESLEGGFQFTVGRSL